MFGGTTISLILPKLIRSVARDGIWTFLSGTANIAAPLFSHLTTQGKRAAFNGCLPKLNTDVSVMDFNKSVLPQRRERGGSTSAAAPLNIHQLLDFDFGARFFELLLGGIRISLVGSFEQRLGRA